MALHGPKKPKNPEGAPGFGDLLTKRWGGRPASEPLQAQPHQEPDDFLDHGFPLLIRVVSARYLLETEQVLSIHHYIQVYGAAPAIRAELVPEIDRFGVQGHPMYHVLEGRFPVARQGFLVKRVNQLVSELVLN